MESLLKVTSILYTVLYILQLILRLWLGTLWIRKWGNHFRNTRRNRWSETYNSICIGTKQRSQLLVQHLVPRMVLSNRKWRRDINSIKKFTSDRKFIKEFFSLLCVLQNQHELRHWQPIRVDRCWFDSISFELLRHSLVDLYLGASPWILAFYVMHPSVESIGSIIGYDPANRGYSGYIKCFVRKWIFDLQFPGNWFEFGIILSDF